MFLIILFHSDLPVHVVSTHVQYQFNAYKYLYVQSKGKTNLKICHYISTVDIPIKLSSIDYYRFVTTITRFESD